MVIDENKNEFVWFATFDGKIINDEPYYDFTTRSLSDGIPYLEVQRADDLLWNVIDLKGNEISNEWFKRIFGFKRVDENDEPIDVVDYRYLTLVNGPKGCNFMNEKGEIISEQWFDYAENYDPWYHYAVVTKYNYTDDKKRMWDSEETYKMDARGRLFQ